MAMIVLSRKKALRAVAKIGSAGKKWEENQKVIREMLDSLKGFETRFESSIGALGARWGVSSEEAFRNGLRAILEESFGVEVIHVTEWDDKGTVFGRPEQIEIDIIIHDGRLIILCLWGRTTLRTSNGGENVVKRDVLGALEGRF